MTNPTLERAARAAADVGAECGLQTNDGAASWEEIGVHYADIARAVLMAVREPDEAVRDNGDRAMENALHVGGSLTEATLSIHHAMIDAILNDGEGTSAGQKSDGGSDTESDGL